jgi:hypothetical protein
VSGPLSPHTLRVDITAMPNTPEMPSSNRAKARE